MSWKYFKRSEFTCRCGCGRNEIHSELVNALDDLRERCNFAIAVTSGFRCSHHNTRVSSTGRYGPHTTGKAADLRVDRGKAFAVLMHAMTMNKESLEKGGDLIFTGFGLNQKGEGRFIHLDVLTELEAHPRPTVWTY